MKINHHPETDWQVYINENQELKEGRQFGQAKQFGHVFRTGWKDNQSCTFFTLSLKHADVMLAQVGILENGNVFSNTFLPLSLSIDYMKKIIWLDTLCNFRISDDGKLYYSFVGETQEVEFTAHLQ